MTCDCERSDSTTLAQALELINGDSVRSKLDRRGQPDRPPDPVGGRRTPSILEELALSPPIGHEFEARTAVGLPRISWRKPPDRRKAWEDLAWAIVNGKEFLLRH